MKKFALALTALAAFTGSAVAADLPARSCLFEGSGGGRTRAELDRLLHLRRRGWRRLGCEYRRADVLRAGVSHDHNRQGGDGCFGTVGAGYDWQLSQRWVFGILGDGQFGSLKGSIAALAGLVGNVKLKDTWAVGARVGYLVAPLVFSYVNAGYTGSEWSARP